MKIKIRKLNSKAKIPSRAHDTDAGFDITATSKFDDSRGNIVYGTGISMQIPEGYVGLCFPRSSVAKTHLMLSNSVGVIDSGYRGEILFKFKKTYSTVMDGKNWHDSTTDYCVGDRIGQIIIMPLPDIEFEETDKLDDSDRGIGGYGSSGN